MIVTAKVRIEHYLCTQKLTIYYTTYFCHEGCLPSQIFGLLLPISPKSRSNVALLLSIHSQQWVCLEGKTLQGHTVKTRVHSRAYTERHLQWRALTNTAWALQLHSPNDTCLQISSLELPPTAPTGKADNDSWKSAQMWPGGFCFSAACLDFVYILPLFGYKQLGMQSLLHSRVLEMNLFTIKNSWYDM